MSEVYHCSCGSDHSSEDVKDVHEANGHIVQDRRNRSVSTDTKREEGGE